MTQFYKSGNTYSIVGVDRGIKVTQLPNANFSVKASKFGYYFDQMPEFDLPKKVYGKAARHADRILSTYGAREKNTGVILGGEKGSGKTLLAKMVGIKGNALGYPVLIIQEPFAGPDFSDFLQEITQPCIVFIDEFEKIYDDEAQIKMLGLLDGVYKMKKLFILTCNNIYKVNQFIHNRPSRAFYQINYEGLEPEFIREYTEDNLDNKGHIEQVCQVGYMFHNMNYDILSSLIEEMNRYKEGVLDSLEILNAKMDHNNITYNQLLYVKGELVEEIDCDQIHSNPLIMKEIGVTDYSETNDAESETIGQKEYRHYKFTQQHLISYDAKIGKITYQNPDNQTTLVFERPKSENFSLRNTGLFNS